MNGLTISRLLTAETLGFHIIWATIGVGLPIFISIAEAWGIYRKDPHYILMARRWTRGFVITVAVGVVTGTCIGLMLSLLWPRFMKVAGSIISLPLFLETFAFFFEAIFLGIYLYTWDRFRHRVYHWLTSIPIIVGSTMSAVFITTVNAWMNTPSGFSVKNGIFSNIHPLEAMLNPAMPTKVAHVLSSAYLTGAFLLAAIAAYHMVKGPRHVYFQKTLRLTMVSGFILAIATLIAGDLSGKFLAEHQPEKLAAAEWHFDTQQRAPLVLGGMLDLKTLEVRYGIQIPLALSILAKGSTNGEVKGLNDIPRHLWPPLFVHYLFDMMVAIGFYLIFISAVFLFLWAKKEGNEWHPWVMRGIVAGAPLSFLAIELGWIYAEVGRQPWMIRGIMTVKEGVTTSGHTLPVFLIFTFLYSVLGVIAVTVLNRLFRNKTPESEMADRNIIL